MLQHVLSIMAASGYCVHWGALEAASDGLVKGHVCKTRLATSHPDTMFFEIQAVGQHSVRVPAYHYPPNYPPSSASRASWTHFISLPLNLHGQLDCSYKAFQQSAAALMPDFDASVFVPPRRLHLTVCMLSLNSQKEIALAGQAMGLALARTKKAVVDVVGIDVMKGSVDLAKVLFASVHPTDALNSLNRALCEQIQSCGLVSNAESEPKVQRAIYQ